MKWIIIAGTRSGSVTYIGPFDTRAAAIAYGEGLNAHRWFVKELSSP
jgi:hypothetical protein